MPELRATLAFSALAINDGDAPGIMPWRGGRGVGGLANRTTEVELGQDAAAMADLLAAVAVRGDRQAFARLFQHYAPRIKTFMRKLGTEDALAEELAQEAMLMVWRKAPSFDRSKANAGTWIFAIARNLRIDMIRHEKRPEIDCDDPCLVADSAPRADELVASGQDQRRIAAAMAGLPAEQAEVVTLSFYEDTPHAEIAARLKIPLGTVKSRLRLAMKRIRAEFGDDGS
jgi:RNA polymerase sigma-70 factor (ECF subfamily)